MTISQRILSNMRKAYFPALATGPSLSKTHHQKPTIKSSQFLALFNPLYELAYVPMFIPHCHLKVCVCVWLSIPYSLKCGLTSNKCPPVLTSSQLMTLLQLLAGSRGDLRLVSKLLPKLQQYFGKVREKTSLFQQQERTWKQCGALPVEGRFVNWLYYQDKSTTGHKKTMAGGTGSMFVVIAA